MNCSGYHADLMDLARAVGGDACRKQELQSHLRQCERCRKEFDAQVRLNEAAASLAADAALVAAPPALEAVLLAEFDRAQPLRKPVRRATPMAALRYGEQRQRRQLCWLPGASGTQGAGQRPRRQSRLPRC